MIETLKLSWHNETRIISDLIPYPKNPRRLTEKQYTDLKNSLSRFSLVEVPAIDTDNKIISGHMRLKILSEIEGKGFKVDVRVPNRKLTDKEFEEYNIRANKNTGEFDFDILANEFELEDLQDWGFEEDELLGFGDDLEGTGTEDDTPAVPKVARSQIGDLYELGNHRVLCGDSTDKEIVAVLMDGDKAVLLHADPPYGMGKEKDGILNDNLYDEKLDQLQMEWWKAFRPHLIDNGSYYIWGNAEDLWRLWYKGGLKDSERLTFRNEIIWDKGHGLGMKSSQHRMFPTVSERCIFFMLGEQGFNNNADNYWDGWDSIVNYLKTEKEKSGLKIKDFKRVAGHSEESGCHWFDKSQWMMPTRETYQAWQLYCQGKNDAFKKDYDALKKDFYKTRAYFDNAHDNMTDVWQFERVQGEERHGHATPKPVKMIERIIKSSSQEMAIVIEPFLGSGSTLIACEKTKRRCYGMEIDPLYTDVIVQRYVDYTGNNNIKLNGEGIEW